MEFSTVRSGALTYLTASNIAVSHGFTTRLGGVSQGHLASLNLGMHRGDDPETVTQNYRILGDALGFSPEQLVLTRQTHSDIVRVVDRADAGQGLDHRLYPECDALVTNTPGIALAVFTADCTPILFYDPVTGAVGAAHAGWRGTAAGIAAKTVETMVRAFGCDPGNIRAAIGPHIGPCCFQTDGDVPEAMLASLGEDAQTAIRTAGDKHYVNLTEINTLWLRRSGVTSITTSTDCTFCQPDLYWSHRYTRGQRGSQGAVIIRKEESI